jgi:hypothetical protein
LGSAGFPDGFIGLGVLAVLPIPLPVVVPGEMFGFVVPIELPEPIVPEEEEVPEAVPALPAVPAPPAPPAPPACANANVLESASAPANAKVVILMVVSFG